MRLSEDRVARLAQEIANELLDEELVDLEIDENKFVFLVESLILEDLKVEDQIDEEATVWLRKHRPHLEEGTTQWEIEMDRIKEELAVSKGYVIR